MKKISYLLTAGVIGATLAACSSTPAADWGADAAPVCSLITLEDVKMYVPEPEIGSAFASDCHWEDANGENAYFTLRIYEGDTEYKNFEESELLAGDVKYRIYSPGTGNQDTFESRFSFYKDSHSYMISARGTRTPPWISDDKQKKVIEKFAKNVSDAALGEPAESEK